LKEISVAAYGLGQIIERLDCHRRTSIGIAVSGILGAGRDQHLNRAGFAGGSKP
jgi:hypothetical protein